MLRRLPRAPQPQLLAVLSGSETSVYTSVLECHVPHVFNAARMSFLLPRKILEESSSIFHLCFSKI